MCWPLSLSLLYFIFSVHSISINSMLPTCVKKPTWLHRSTGKRMKWTNRVTRLSNENMMNSCPKLMRFFSTWTVFLKCVIRWISISRNTSKHFYWQGKTVFLFLLNIRTSWEPPFIIRIMKGISSYLSCPGMPTEQKSRNICCYFPFSSF